MNQRPFPIRRLLLALLMAAAALYLGVCAWLYASQDAMLYYPRPMSSASPADLITLPGPEVRVRVSAREREGAKALVYFGGNAEDVSRNLPEFAAAFPEHALYLLHYRGYGGSEGKPSEPALMADALALFDLAQARHPQVTVVGRSLGSGLAVRVASERPVARLVLVTPFDSLAGIGAALYPVLPVRWLMRDQYDSGKLAPRVRAPTLIIAAERDEIIPAWSTQALHSRFQPGVARLVVIEGAGHNTVSDSADYLPMLVSP